LARTWPDDTASREALIAVTRDRELRVQTIAVWGLVRAWAGDADALDALASLTQDHSEETREIAVEGLAEGWPGNDSARDALLPLVQDAVQHVREVSIEMLLQSWPGDVTTRDTLLRLLRANDAGVREVAVNGLSNGWPSDASVADALLAMLADPVPTVRWAAEQGLALRGKAAAKSRMGFTGSELLVEVGDHRNAHRAHPGQEANSNDYGPLIAARVPHDFYIGKRLSTNRTLCRGIKFNPGINIVFGENGTGKTLFLKALAIQTGAIEGSRLRQLTNHFPWARDLAEHLDILWGENLTPEDCFYLGPKELDNRSRQNELEKVLAAPPTYRLYLLDDPTSSREFGATSRIYRKMNQFSQQGCQVIIVTSDFKRLRPIVPTDAKVIRLGSRRLRDRMTALGW
jgi:predicted ATPase